VVLDRTRNNVAAAGAGGEGNTADRGIVASLPPLVKTISFGRAPTASATPRPGRVHLTACLASLHINARGVPACTAEYGQHRLEDARVEGRRCGVIEVDAIGGCHRSEISISGKHRGKRVTEPLRNPLEE